MSLAPGKSSVSLPVRLTECVRLQHYYSKCNQLSNSDVTFNALIYQLGWTYCLLTGDGANRPAIAPIAADPRATRT